MDPFPTVARTQGQNLAGRATVWIQGAKGAVVAPVQGGLWLAYGLVCWGFTSPRC